MDNKKETIEDIAIYLDDIADNMEKTAKTINEERKRYETCRVHLHCNRYADIMREASDTRKLAILIRSAWKRERRIIVESATAEMGKVLHVAEASKDGEPQGFNAAALREALDEALSFIGNLEIEPYSPLDEDASELRQKIMDALSAPARNCDVGTAEEQWKRFYEFCIDWEESGPDGGCSDGCPCMAIKSKKSDGCFGQSGCFAIWAQMPYEEEKQSPLACDGFKDKEGGAE